ncbi:TPA: glycosyl transferase family 1, partial [Streptococcus pyogenes]
GTIDKTENGYQVAQTRAIEHVAAELAAAYRQTLEL